jgi:hypothetical protein
MLRWCVRQASESRLDARRHDIDAVIMRQPERAKTAAAAEKA